MRSYLSLIPLSARVRRRQNRMTLLCIVFAVFLVTAIFSTADMLVRLETNHAKDLHGNWQICLQNIDEDEAQAIANRDDVAAASWYEAVNFDGSQGYTVDGHPAVLCGIEGPFMTSIMHYFDSDSSIADHHVVLTPNARSLLGVERGDTITLDTAGGDIDFTVSGFRSNDSKYAGSNGGETTALLVDNEQVGIFMSHANLEAILQANGEESNGYFYVQFSDNANIKQAVTELQQTYNLSDEDIEQNFILMGLAGLSNNSMVQNIYPLVFAFFVMILLAGVLMIAGSLNSSIAERTQFFGMMRCIGMSKQQVVRFVRLEALNWCKTAVPIGVILGVVTAWGLNGMLKYFVGGEFSDIQVLGVSPFGIVSGAIIGLLTVLIAAQAPAKRAAKVSPAAAVTSNTSRSFKLHRIHLGQRHIAYRLGIAHAGASKKNLVLMSGSFALSIVLFLSFSVLVQLLSCLLPDSIAAPNLSVQSEDVSNTVPHALADEIGEMNGVTHTFGRALASDVPAIFSVEADQTTVDLISYSDLQLDWLPEDDMLRAGSDLSAVYGDHGSVLAIWDEANPLNIGDTVQIGDNTLTISGFLRYSPFSNSGRTDGEIILICSEATFARLTGTNDYAIIDIQLSDEATDADVTAIQERVQGHYDFIDRRDEADRSTFYAFSIFLYGFLVIIALITVLNIINSIAMSVSSRIRQYGAMRAVGMDCGQLTRMITAEAATYAGIGGLLGCATGLPLNWLLYERLITTNYPYYTWSLPLGALGIILAFIALATVLSVYAPAKRIHRMAITETINEL